MLRKHCFTRSKDTPPTSQPHPFVTFVWLSILISPFSTSSTERGPLPCSLVTMSMFQISDCKKLNNLVEKNCKILQLIKYHIFTSTCTVRSFLSKYYGVKLKIDNFRTTALYNILKTFSPCVSTRTLEASCVDDDSVAELSSQSSGMKGHQMTRWYSVEMPRGRVIFRSSWTLIHIKKIIQCNGWVLLIFIT